MLKGQMKTKINIVWFKRDFRLTDHAPLRAAIGEGLPILLLSFFEPSLIAAPEMAERHWRFQYECIDDLNEQLTPHGGRLYAIHAEVLPTLERLARDYDIHRIFSHQETGLKVTFDRDLAVKSFCRERGIVWREYRQDGVFRGLRSREHWTRRWEKDMQAPLAEVDLPALGKLAIKIPDFEAWPDSRIPDAYRSYKPDFQRGGMSYARRYWTGFLRERARSYSRHLSKPGPSRRSCSRLSPYIAYGAISVREIFQTIEKYRHRPGLQRPLENFRSRVWWRTHYMQKLESEWQLEFEPLNRALAGLDRHRDEQVYTAWATGQTGIPMVDASIRCLESTGWLNFRMRAMLATYATFGLWLDWKPVAIRLANLFTDFEPGIHYGQIQMQAGLTGYHTLRIFNPTIQIERHDPAGDFVKKWVPELRKVPTPQLYEPWNIPRLEQEFLGCVIGRDYPAPVMPYAEATRRHRDHYWTYRQRPEVKAYLPKLWARHCLPDNVAMYKEQLGM